MSVFKKSLSITLLMTLFATTAFAGNPWTSRRQYEDDAGTPNPIFSSQIAMVCKLASGIQVFELSVTANGPTLGAESKFSNFVPRGATLPVKPWYGSMEKSDFRLAPFHVRAEVRRGTHYLAGEIWIDIVKGARSFPGRLLITSIQQGRQTVPEIIHTAVTCTPGDDIKWLIRN